MLRLLILLCSCTFLARCSEQYSRYCEKSGERYYLRYDLGYWGLLIFLVLFSGLRIHYNDTSQYINSFYNSVGFVHFLENPENLNPFRNPFYYGYQSILRSTINNAYFLIFSTSLFTQVCFIWFFKRYSKHFTFSVFIYITLGTFCFSMAAIKQVVAMAILTLAFPYLEKNKLIPYYLLVVLAMLFHTYALSYIFLPLFIGRPWKPFTYFFVAIVVIVLVNFQDAITAFMEQANELGKTMSESEIFDNHTVNFFRLMVYLLTPVASFCFQRWLFHDSGKIDHIMFHMSIISAACMILGTQSGANMFGRMATYFELGTICCLPTFLEKTFNRRSYQALLKVSICCFMAYFIYAYGLSQDFDANYRAITLWTFLDSLFS